MLLQMVTPPGTIAAEAAKLFPELPDGPDHVWYTLGGNDFANQHYQVGEPPPPLHHCRIPTELWISLAWRDEVYRNLHVVRCSFFISQCLGTASRNSVVFTANVRLWA